MNRLSAIAATLIASLAAGTLAAQQPAPADRSPSSSATASACPITPAPDGTFDPMSSNVKVYGAIYSAESCSYDPDRGVIVVPNRGVAAERADQQRVDLVHQPRRVGAHRALDRHPEPGPSAPA